MEIKQEYPPNIDKIVAKLNIKGLPTVFTYGDILYNPTGGYISDDLMAHEETHARQQKEIGVQLWWERYLESDAFRLSQELEAYRVQYRSVELDRKSRRDFLTRIARNLSSRLYGHVINLQEAKELIKNA